MSHAFRHLPQPTPLRRAALIEYEWGPQHFEIICTACSLRLIEWPDTGEEVVWLHCNMMPLAELNPNGPTRMLNVLIPAHYISPASRKARRSDSRRVSRFQALWAFSLPSIQRPRTACP
jgi:hypothetical protein